MEVWLYLKLLADRLDITGTFLVFEWKRLCPQLPFSGPSHTCSASINTYKHKKKYVWTGPATQVLAVLAVLALVAASSRFTRTFSCASAYACVVRVKQPGKIRFQFNLAESIQFTQGNTDYITNIKSQLLIQRFHAVWAKEKLVSSIDTYCESMWTAFAKVCHFARRLLAFQTISLTKRKYFQSIDCKGMVQILPSAIRQKTDARGQ